MLKLGRATISAALVAWPHALTFLIIYFFALLTTAQPFGRKSDICGSWNNYCNGGPASPNAGNRNKGNSNELNTTPDGTGWYCRARANNGAWGWGESLSQERANRIAITQCQSYSRGRACSITSCSLGGGKNHGAPAYSKPRRDTPTAPRSVSPAQAPKQQLGRTVDHAKTLKLEREREHQKELDKAERERKAREARLERERQALAATQRRLAAAVERGDYRTAVAVQAELVDANKYDPKHWLDFATYLEKSGQLDDAATAFRRSASLAGKDASPLVAAMYQRDAAARAANGDFLKAIAQQAMAVEADNNNAGLWRGLAEYMEKDGQLDNAAVALRRAHMLGAPNPEDKIFAMYFERMLTNAGSGDADRRIELYRSFVEKFPDARSNFARHHLADELIKQKRIGEAQDILQRITALDPADNTARGALVAMKGSDQAGSMPLAGLERSHGERDRGKVVYGGASAGQGTSGATVQGKQNSEPRKDLQTVTQHGRNAVETITNSDAIPGNDQSKALAAAKDQAMLGFDTPGKQVAPLPTVIGPAGRNVGHSDAIPKDIGADVPAAKRQQVIAALGKNPEWAKLADRRNEIEAKRADIAKHRDELVASYQSSEIKKDPQKRAAIATEIAKTVIEDDKVRNDLHDVKIEQKKTVEKVVETVSFAIELVDEKKADDTELPKTNDTSPAELVPTPLVRQ